MKEAVDVWREVIPRDYRVRMLRTAGLPQHYADWEWGAIPPCARSYLHLSALCELSRAEIATSVLDDCPAAYRREVPA